MSKITLEPNSSGAGTFSIVSPDSNTNRTLNLPDESGTVATIENIPPGYEDQDALDLFNVTGSAPVYACRAWVNFSSSSLTIRDSGNVSSITDVGTGISTVNFAISMPDGNYSVSCGGTMRGEGSSINAVHQVANTSGGQVNDFAGETRQHDINGVTVNNKGSNGTLYDSDHFTVMIFR
jgi:hypothetical protein